MAIVQSLYQRPFVVPRGFFAGRGLAIESDDAQNWLAATAAADDLQLTRLDGADPLNNPLANWQRNETQCFSDHYGEAIEIDFIRNKVISETDPEAQSEVRSVLSDDFIRVRLRACGGKRDSVISAIKADVASIIEAAKERKEDAIASTDNARSKSKVVYDTSRLKTAAGVGILTQADHARIQAQLALLQAKQDMLDAIEDGMLKIELEGGVGRYVQIPMDAIRFYDVAKVGDRFEIITKAPVFAAGAWGMGEQKIQLNANSAWVQENLGSNADEIAQKLMSMQQSGVLDFLAHAQAQVQRELAQAAQALAQTTSKLACDDACQAALGGLSPQSASLNKFFPKLPSTPSLMV